jgi:hypothetical protein
MKTPDLAPPLAASTDHGDGSWFANRLAAQRALQRAVPGIAPQVADPQVCGSGFLYIVIMDPGLPVDPPAFDRAVLLEHAIGDRSRWDADYAAFARAKARLSWLHGMDGHFLQSHRAQWLRNGDTLLWGGVCLDGFVVGVSGAQAWYDEAFATTVAAYFRAEVKAGVAEAAARKALFAG